MEDEEPPYPQRRRLPRRGVVLGVGAVLAAGAGLTLLVRSQSRKIDASDARRLAQETYAALRAGELPRAVDLAMKARALDEEAPEPKSAWLHAVGLSLMESDGDGAKAAGFVYEARKLGLRGVELAFATLASAVAMRNDHYARRLVKQHEEQGLANDAFSAFATGAALDLDCDPEGAVESFVMSGARWQDATLPPLRRARSLIFAGKLDDARRALDELGSPSPARAALSSVVERLANPTTPVWVDPATVVDLPRSIRPLAQALLLGGEANFGIDAALGDVDSPLVALCCAKLALAADDLSSAERAADVARQLRSELAPATAMLVEVALLRGDLEKAEEVAFASGEGQVVSLVEAISAYEDRRADDLGRVGEQAREAALDGWPLLEAALGLLGRRELPSQDELKKATDARVPWADVLSVDLALAAGDAARANKLMEKWVDPSPARTRRRDRAKSLRGGTQK